MLYNEKFSKKKNKIIGKQKIISKRMNKERKAKKYKEC
jgi:hypothetical protein